MSVFASILKENVDLKEINLGDLTTDCMFVTRVGGQIDVVRGQSMVKVFDVYHDLGVSLERISLSGGRLNPKIQTPRLE